MEELEAHGPLSKSSIHQNGNNEIFLTFEKYHTTVEWRSTAITKYDYRNRSRKYLDCCNNVPKW